MSTKPDLNQIIKDGADRSVVLQRVGMEVRVLKDDGSYVNTRTRTLPWQLGHGQWVIGLEGFSGGYDILRVNPIF